MQMHVLPLQGTGMSHFHRIAKSRFGTWIKGYANAPFVGPVILAGAQLIKTTTDLLARLHPKNIAHDRRQAATLAAFERQIATASPPEKAAAE